MTNYGSDTVRRDDEPLARLAEPRSELPELTTCGKSGQRLTLIVGRSPTKRLGRTSNPDTASLHVVSRLAVAVSLGLSSMNDTLLG